jgi:CTP:molybdopterin cytidylyltransferase MocA
MYSAVVLAGQSKKQNAITSIQYRFIGEEFLPGYKHTQPITVDGRTGPVILHTVRALRNASLLDDIIIVGDASKLAAIPWEEKISILPQRGSILENAQAGYAAAGKQHHDKVFFICGDVPYIHPMEVDQFVARASTKDADLVFGLVQEPQGYKASRMSRNYFPIQAALDGHEDGTNIRVRHANAFFGKPSAGNAALAEIYDRGRKMLSPASWMYFARNYPHIILQAAAGYLGAKPVSAKLVQENLRRRGCSIDFVLVPHSFEKDIDTVRDLEGKP